MRSYVGAGWNIVHKTERVIHLRKPDPIYWSIFGGDGYVVHKIEPGLVDKEPLIDGAMKKALAMDAEVGLRIAKDIVPTPQAVAQYRRKVAPINRGFRTPEDESVIGRKRV